MFKLREHIYKALKFTARVDAFFFALLYLMVLLVLGTLAQAEIGLYAAQQKYFSSFFMDVGGFPVPSGYSVMGFMFIGLTVKTFTEKLKKQHIGSFVTHFSVWLLFLGGFLTAFLSDEGFMVVEEGQSAQYYSNYHKTELAFIQDLGDKEKVYTIHESAFNNDKNNPQEKNDILASLSFEKFYPNALIQRYGTAQQNSNAHASYNSYKATAKPKEKDHELNQSALILNIKGQKYLVFEDMPFKPRATINGESYTLDLRQKRTYLPFSVYLKKFVKQDYLGTNSAKSYQSYIEIRDGISKIPQLIEMNEPVRYKGYTLFQSSFIEGANDATVLAVVKNKGRLFPYIASILMCVGLLIHLFMRLPRLMRRNAALFLLSFTLFTHLMNQTHAQNVDNDFNYNALSKIPVLENGRIKPLDSFARHKLLQFYGDDKLTDMSATQWLIHLILNPKNAYAQPTFVIKNPALLDMLGLEDYEIPAKLSFKKLIQSIKIFSKDIEKYKLKDSDLSLEQRQLLTLHENLSVYYDISRSFSFVLPLFIFDKNDAEIIGLKSFNAYNYLNLKGKESRLGQLPSNDKLNQFNKVTADSQSSLLKIVPTQWGEANDWFSPWQTLQQGQGSPKTADFFEKWGYLSLAYLANDPVRFNKLASEIQQESLNLERSQNVYTDKLKIELEYFYNKLKPFKWALGLSLFALLMWMLWQVTHSKIGYYSMTFLLSLAFLFEFLGLGLRVFIMSRPPVATLYESILFVAWVVLIFSFIFERKRRDGLGFFMGSALGAVLLFIASRYALDGDTMGNLEAVLNTNFWLATHVVVITIGYGVSLIAGLLGHIYLFYRLKKSCNNNVLNKLYKNTLAAALIALFFSTLGTILGGIWADQSWGRFWGWDPKENGAMLLCLWLIWLLHGRLAGYLRPLYFTALMGLTNVIVALAWFGVNLLGVGLHSYGFTENIAMNLALFCGLELVVIIILLSVNCIKQKEVKLKNEIL